MTHHIKAPIIKPQPTQHKASLGIRFDEAWPTRFHFKSPSIHGTHLHEKKNKFYVEIRTNVHFFVITLTSIFFHL